MQLDFKALKKRKEKKDYQRPSPAVGRMAHILTQPRVTLPPLAEACLQWPCLHPLTSPPTSKQQKLVAVTLRAQPDPGR